jgi:GT2 family glycosyltransferase
MLELFKVGNMYNTSIDLSFVVINWNSGELLPLCIPKLLHQKGLSVEVILIDNNSVDNTKEIIENLPKNVKVILNDKNLGYSGAANQGIKCSRGKYVSIINPDVLLTETYGLEIIKVLEENIEIAAATGKLIKYDFKNKKSLNIIDTTGIEFTRDFKVFDRGQNCSSLEEYDHSTRIFGVSGAAPIYRKAALEDVKVDDEYFDEDFLAYKEDIDLSWRFRKFGWEVIFIPTAIAYHGRAIGRAKNDDIFSFYRHRKSQSQFIRRISLRNHYCLLVKNLSKSDTNFSIHLLIKQELKRLFYCLFFEIKTLYGLIEFLYLLPKMINKRKKIKNASQNRKSTVFFT